jgi:hypothetical protein
MSIKSDARDPARVAATGLVVEPLSVEVGERDVEILLRMADVEVGHTHSETTDLRLTYTPVKSG